MGRPKEEDRERITSTIDKKIKAQFDYMVKEEGLIKSKILDRAIILLLKEKGYYKGDS